MTEEENNRKGVLDYLRDDKKAGIFDYSDVKGVYLTELTQPVYVVLKTGILRKDRIYRCRPIVAKGDESTIHAVVEATSIHKGKQDVKKVELMSQTKIISSAEEKPKEILSIWRETGFFRKNLENVLFMQTDLERKITNDKVIITKIGS